MKKLILLLFVLALAACNDDATDKLVTIKTNYGNMTVLLYDETPLHKANFIKLAESGEYDSTIFHRVIDGFMIQGGDIHLNKPTQELPDGRIEAEIIDGFFHKKGELAATRQGQGNPTRKSSSCQFYIVQGRVYSEDELTTDLQKLNRAIGALIRMDGFDSLEQQFAKLQQDRRFQEMSILAMENKELAEQVLDINLSKEISPEKIEAYSTVGGRPDLDDEYTIFGRVVEGLDVIDRIASVGTIPVDRPLENIYIFMEVKELSKSEITEKYGYVYPEEK